jgi:hypothetical protein
MAEITRKQLADSMGDSKEAATGVKFSSDGNMASFLDGQLAWVQTASEFVPPYWSAARDRRLREFWKQPGSGHIASAIYNAQAKLLSIPGKVIARDASIASHVNQAELLTEVIGTTSEFSAGLQATLEKWYEDFLTQDNGAFMEVLGQGDPSGPIEGQPIGVRHLDASRCVRTGDPEFPVRYHGEDDKWYRFHFTRVIFKSQMPSPDIRLKGVGYSALSRAIDFGQNLMDITTYKREKLGSRPPSKLFIGQGVKGEDIMKVFRAADLQMDSDGLRRYSRSIAIGSDNTDINIKDIDLTTMDQFKEEVSVPFSMFAIALAFGMDPSELWPGASGTNKASAAIGLLRSRGKLPAQVTSTLEREFNFKLLPPHLQFVFDFQDDEEDQQQAIIRDIRARNRERNMYSGVTTKRAERKIMVKDGDIDRNVYIDMELEDGLLEGGIPVETLFYSNDPVFTGPNGLLNLGVEEPMRISQHDTEGLLQAIETAHVRVVKYLASNSSARAREKGKQALAALKQLQSKLMPPLEEGEEQEDSTGPRYRQRTNNRNDFKRLQEKSNEYSWPTITDHFN